MPKILLSDPRYAISTDAKLLYCILLDRMSLSRKNGWQDKNQHTFIYFPTTDIAKLMNYGKNKITKLFKELEDIGLIERNIPGFGGPMRIYVKKFIIWDESVAQKSGFSRSGSGVVQIPENRECQIPENRECQIPENRECQIPENRECQIPENRECRFPKIGNVDSRKQGCNNTDIYNNTEDNDIYLSYPDPQEETEDSDGIDPMAARAIYEDVIKENLDYPILIERFPTALGLIQEMVELIVDIVAGSRPTVRVGGDELPREVVKSRFLKLRFEHIEYVLESLERTTTEIRNIRSYLITTLYNAPVTAEHYISARVRHDMA